MDQNDMKPEGGSTADDAAFLRSLLGALPAFVIRAGPDLNIRYINRLALGFTLDDAIGRSIFEFIASEYQSIARASVQRAIEFGTVQQYLAHAQTDHRAYAYYETIVAPIPEPGGGTGVILVAFDVTRTHELEERVRQSEKMQSLGTLTAGMAHNFNNLLAVIRPTLDLLHAHVDADGRSLLEEATQATERATNLIRQLMTFAGTRRSQDAGACDLGQVVESAVHMTRRLLEPEFRISFEREAGALPIRAHDTEVEQVVVNLILNARDAMRGAAKIPGEIRVRVFGADEAGAPSNRAATRGRAVVEDDGPGIDPSLIPRLFDPFFTTKRPGEGTGLGLAVSWSVIQNLGGTIECQSRPGEGARFSIDLPLAVDPQI